MHVTEDRKLLLAQQILKATREGISYEQVYEELALEWKTNAEECRLLWEEEVGAHYQKAVEIARLFHLSQTGKKPSVSGSNKRKTKVRKGVSIESKKTGDTRPVSSPVIKETQEESVNLKEILVFLEQVEEKMMAQEEVNAIYQENVQLKKELEQIKEKHQQMEEDFRFLKKLFRDAEALQRVM